MIAGRWLVLLGLLGLLAACGRAAPPPLVAAGISAPAPTAPALPETGFIGVVVDGDAAELEASVEGRIEIIYVQPGDVVERGAPIAKIDAEASAQDLASARAGLAEASRRLARRRKLARGKLAAVTPEEVDAARREVLQARAGLARMEKARAQAVVVAPFAGTVAERYLAAGALAGPGRAIARLVGRGQPQVRFAVPEERAAEVAVGAAMDVRIAPAGRLTRARVTSVAPEVDVSARMVFASARLEPAPPGAAPLRTGLLARVFLAPVAGRQD
jgi:RND family efflux transporter MFP subunit